MVSAAGPTSRAAAMPALLAAGVLLTWMPSLGASLQFDDWNVIIRDPRVQSLAAWLASMPGIRPLLKLTYAIGNEFGAGPAALRAFNVVVHATNAVLVSWLLRTLGLRLALPAGKATFAALVGATVFALHPVQTEAVTYVSGRSSALSALFALAALLAWLRGLDAPDERRWRWASFALFVVALGVKEPVVALPLVMAAWLVAVRATATIPRRIAPHALLLLAGALVVLAWPPYRAVLDGSLDARALGSTVLSQVNAVTWLIGQMVRFDRLNADPAMPTVEAIDAALALRAALLLALAAAGVALLRRRPAAGFAIAWFFLWLLPTNSVVPRVDLVNDRQLYLPIVGPAWLLGLLLAAPLGAHGATATRPTPRWPRLALAALALLLAAATIARNRVYVDEIAFWQDVARKSPHNPRAANNLGYAYALACRDAEALAEFERAMRLDPDDYRAPINRRLLSEGALFAENQRHCPQAPPAR
jgi:tetratricopeptide (TPR) repeat protein